MKKLILIAIVLAIGWYGNYLYRHSDRSRLTQQLSVDPAYNNPKKCITKDGKVFYGKIPQGTVCVQEKQIEGMFTVVPSENSSKSVQVSFNCDGRIYCSQMTSCEEATFFLRNCPNVKMDGNNDEIPCEKQWCKS